MIIRKRQLNEAPSIRDKISSMQDKALGFIEQNKLNIDDLVARVMFGEGGNNKYGTPNANYQAFEKLNSGTKQNFYNACKNELENNEFRFPFFELIRKNGADKIITDINKSFLKCYNWCLNNNISFIKASKGKKENILLIKDLYSDANGEKIASLYYNTKFNEKWKNNIKNINSIDKNLLSQFSKTNGVNDNQDFINRIFYTGKDGEEKIRPLNDIKTILSILNGEESDNEENSFYKILSNSKSEQQLQKIADGLSKEQAATLITLLQKK